MYRANAKRTGYIDESGPLYNTNTQSLHDALGQSRDAAWVGLLGCGQDLVATFADGSLCKWDPTAEVIRWERALHSEVAAAPLLQGDKLFVPNAGGGLWALRTEDGSILWRAQPDHGLMGSPLVARDLIWCGSVDGYLLGVEADTGALQERFSLHQHGFFSAAASDGGLIFWGDPMGQVCAFDLAAGKMRWRYHTHNAILACPTVDGDQLLVGTAQGQLLALSTEEGLLRWSTKLKGPLYHPVAVGPDTHEQGAIYATTQDGSFHVLQKHDGHILKQFDFPGNHAVDGPLVTNNGVVFCSSHGWGGRVCIYHADMAPLQHYIYPEVAMAPVLLGDSFYYGAKGGQIGKINGLQVKPAPPKPAPKPEVPAAKKAPVSAVKKAPAKTDPHRQKLLDKCNLIVQSAYGMFRETPDRAASVKASGVYAFDSVRWERQLNAGGVYATPVIVDQRVYVCTFEGWIFALDLSTGDIDWKSQAEGQFWSTPAVIGGAIVTATDQGHMITYNRTDGGVLADYNVGGEINASPVVVDGVTYTANYDGKVFAYRQLDRTEYWTFQARGSVHSSIAISDEMAVFGCKEGYVYALDRLTGELLWEVKTGGWVYSSPAICDGVVYVGSDDHHFYVLDGRAKGALLWKYRTGDEVVSCPAIQDDIVYVGSRDSCLYAFERTYGHFLWKYEAEDYLYGSPVVAGDVVYFASVDNYVYALERYTGSLLWKFRCENHIWASPAVCDGMVVVVDKEGRVYALQDGDNAKKKRNHGRPKPSFNESWAGTPPNQTAAAQEPRRGTPAQDLHHQEPSPLPPAQWKTAELLSSGTLSEARRALLEQLLVRPYALRLQDMLRSKLIGTIHARDNATEV